jgi:hypothetical protein
MGTAGPHTRAHYQQLVHGRFLSLGDDRRVADAAAGLDQMSPRDLREWITSALKR